MDATDEAFDNVLKFHLDNGTTSVVATSVTASISSTERFLNFCREYINNINLLGCKEYKKIIYKKAIKRIKYMKYMQTNPIKHWEYFKEELY